MSSGQGHTLVAVERHVDWPQREMMAAMTQLDDDDDDDDDGYRVADGEYDSG